MDVLALHTPGLGDHSYLLTQEREGLLVDPQRDIRRFLDAIDRAGIRLRFVLDTHLHNDYVSGAKELAMATGAELILPAAAAPAYSHTPAFHLETIAGDPFAIRPIHTPGHTPEHTSYLVLVGGAPGALFSGGSLLVGSAGRSDLLGAERARTMALLQHSSLQRLAQLPPEVRVFPTHGQGSFCTAAGAQRNTSTIGQECADNPLLSVRSAEEFADRVLAAPMPIPAFYRDMGKLNTIGMPPVPDWSSLPEMKITDLANQAAGTRVVDIRPRGAQAVGILRGSLAIEVADDFGSWTGWLVPRDTPTVLLAEPDQDITEPLVQLARIGFDTVRGVVREQPDPEHTVGFELVGLDRFRALWQASDPGQLLDVRMSSEWADARLEGATLRFLPDLIAGGVPPELDPERPVLVACGTGRRACVAAGFLADQGYRPIVLDGSGVPDLVGSPPRRAG